jgi:hypothetical protein
MRYQHDNPQQDALHHAGNAGGVKYLSNEGVIMKFAQRIDYF